MNGNLKGILGLIIWPWCELITPSYFSGTSLGHFLEPQMLPALREHITGQRMSLERPKEGLLVVWGGGERRHEGSGSWRRGSHMGALQQTLKGRLRVVPTKTQLCSGQENRDRKHRDTLKGSSYRALQVGTLFLSIYYIPGIQEWWEGGLCSHHTLSPHWQWHLAISISLANLLFFQVASVPSGYSIAFPSLVPVSS
jgi:hypothetical protein